MPSSIVTAQDFNIDCFITHTSRCVIDVWNISALPQWGMIICVSMLVEVPFSGTKPNANLRLLPNLRSTQSDALPMAVIRGANDGAVE
jgi:hypothetical protein